MSGHEWMKGTIYELINNSASDQFNVSQCGPCEGCFMTLASSLFLCRLYELKWKHLHNDEPYRPRGEPTEREKALFFLHHVSCVMYHGWCVMYHGSCVMCQVSCVMCHVSCVVYHVTCMMCHVSCVMCHVSCMMWHVSCVMCHVSCVTESLYKRVCVCVGSSLSVPDGTGPRRADGRDGLHGAAPYERITRWTSPSSPLSTADDSQHFEGLAEHVPNL